MSVPGRRPSGLLVGPCVSKLLREHDIPGQYIAIRYRDLLHGKGGHGEAGFFGTWTGLGVDIAVGYSSLGMAAATEHGMCFK